MNWKTHLLLDSGGSLPASLVVNSSLMLVFLLMHLNARLQLVAPRESHDFHHVCYRPNAALVKQKKTKQSHFLRRTYTPMG